MTDARLFTPEAARLQAIEVRRLLTRLQSSEGEDRILGADILDIVEAPPTIGDVTGCLDCAFHLATCLKQDAEAVMKVSLLTLKNRVTGGWKPGDDRQLGAAVARQMTINILRTHLANLERAPA